MIRLLMVWCLLMNSAYAAVTFNVLPNTMTYHQDEASHLMFDFRKDVKKLEITIADNHQKTNYHFQQFNLPQGQFKWQWHGQSDNQSRLSPGFYQVNASVLFEDGQTDNETIPLRIYPPKKITSVPTFAPPLFKYKPPDYHISGLLSGSRRYQKITDQYLTENAFDTKLIKATQQWQADGQFSYFQRGDAENTKNSNAGYHQQWSKHRVDLIYRQNLGFFSDPLRLYADFKTEHDKVGIKYSHQYLDVITAQGKRSDGGRENIVAGQIKVPLISAIRLNLSHVRHDLAQTTALNDSHASNISMDATFRQHQFQLSGVSTETDKANHGEGYRFNWLMKSRMGLKTQLGYLDLSEHYNAALSDPGNQISRDLYGPEGSVDYLYSGQSWLSRLGLNLSGFDYKKHSDKTAVYLIQLGSQLTLFKKYQFSLNYRQKSENQTHFETFQLSEQHLWFSKYPGNLQYSNTFTTGTQTHRFNLSFSTGLGQYYHRIALDNIYKEGSFVKDGPFIENSLILSGRYDRFYYDLNVRNTTSKASEGVNGFLYLAYQQQFLQRYDWRIYLELGDRSAIESVPQIEMGLSIGY